MFAMFSKCLVFNVAKGRELLVAVAPMSRSVNSINIFRLFK